MFVSTGPSTGLPSRLNAARNSGDLTSFNLSSSVQISCWVWFSWGAGLGLAGCTGVDSV